MAYLRTEDSLQAARGEVPDLETPRLRLRAWGEGDVAPYARIIRDWGVMRFMGYGRRYKAKRAVASALAAVSDAEARRDVERLAGHWRRHGYGEWAVEEKATGALIGRIGLKHHSDFAADPSRVEIGWLLARDAWGRGYATEGAGTGLATAFGRLGLERIISITAPDNGRSRRVMEHLGLRYVGRTRWRRSEVVWYAIDRPEWERLRDDGGA